MSRKTVIALLAVVLIGLSPTVASARSFGFHGFGGGGWHGGGWSYRGFGGWGLGVAAFAGAVIGGAIASRAYGYGPYYGGGSYPGYSYYPAYAGYSPLLRLRSLASNPGTRRSSLLQALRIRLVALTASAIPRRAVNFQPWCKGQA
jgi:hypothetical protein